MSTPNYSNGRKRKFYDDSHLTRLEALKDRLVKHREKNMHTDFTIVHGLDRYPVHSAILGASSDFFNSCCNGKWKEAEERKVELRGDSDPVAVSEMIAHCYGSSFDAKKTGFCAYKTMASVYVLGDKYGIASLKAAALEFVKQHTIDTPLNAAQVEAIFAGARIVYSSTVDTDRAMRDLFVYALTDNWKKCVEIRRLRELLGNSGLFATDVALNLGEYKISRKRTRKVTCDPTDP
ncbi:hypothetical protein MMC25_005542 [Agyrium rufum]|nr:hypothetical protein [Agyrium rufum]